MLDEEACFQAAKSKDARFDGMFVIAVSSTHIYCRPSCPANPPKREHMRFLPTAASAHALGYRACKRCRPDASPGSPEWNLRSDLVARAMRLIKDGVIERDGVPGLADRLGYGERQLLRQMQAELGSGPLALARAQRAESARILLESTSLPSSNIAFAAGFSSIRQFNDTVREVYALTPSELRERAHKKTARQSAGQAITLRLAYRLPFDVDWTFSFLQKRAVPGIEEHADGAYRRVLSLPHAPGIISLSPGEDDGRRGHIDCALYLEDLRDLTTAVARARRLLDLDADPLAIDAALGADPSLAASVATKPGRRVPGSVDPNELVVRALLGQQVSVEGARTLTARLVARYGEPLEFPRGGLTHRFPPAEVLAEADPGDLAMPESRKRAFFALNQALAKGEVVLDAGADRDEVAQQLVELPGIGPWTASYVAMRALGDPDAFLSGDLGVKKAFERAGLDSDVASIERRSALWRPWRAYALQHLWSSLDEHRGTPLQSKRQKGTAP